MESSPGGRGHLALPERQGFVNKGHFKEPQITARQKGVRCKRRLPLVMGGNGKVIALGEELFNPHCGKCPVFETGG